MKEIKEIDDPEQLKALSDPRRLEIVKLLIQDSYSVSEIAAELGTERSQLYYHLSELERLGLIEVVERRQKGNLLEKYFGSVAEFFRVDRTLFSEVPEGLEMFMDSITGILDAAELDLQRLIEQERLTRETVDDVRHTQRGLRVPADRIQELEERIYELFEEFEEEDRPPSVNFTMVMYPSPQERGDGESSGGGAEQ